jgi:hypothetical protein
VSTWTQVASCATILEAEMLVEQLRAAGIPAVIHSEGAGFFGAGFQGLMPSGATVSVPPGAAAEATEVIGPVTPTSEP